MTSTEYLERIASADENLKAFLYVPETPLTSGEGPLSNLSIAVKDAILVKDWPATGASKILEGFIAPYDATVIKRLKAAGASFVGRTNMDEFAMGGSTENSAYQVTKNPWDTSRVPGGSSGGSAVAVAADLCDVALGSDTGGSIRQPAAFCGVTGLKPTYGAVSRYGLMAMASSCDVIGPMARTAEDVEKVFAIISGQDENDQTTFDYKYEPKNVEIKGLRVGLPKEFWAKDKINGEITMAVQGFVDWLREKGAEIVDVSLPSIHYALPAYYIIVPAEVMANMERYDGIRYQKSVSKNNLLEQYKATRALLGPEVKRRILLGAYVLSVGHYDDYYQLAVRARQQIKREYLDVFSKVDILVSATTSTLPYEINSQINDPVAMYQADLLTISANLAGVPALSLPVGFSQNNFPMGAQITAKHQGDNILLSLAKQYQTETDWHTRTAIN